MKISTRTKILNPFRAIFKIPLLERVLASACLGKSADQFFCKFVPNPYQYPPRTYRQVHRNGISLQVDISDYIGHFLYFGFYDSSAEKLFSLCKQNDTILDIGTNIGWVALNFARISQTGRVIGFEPDPYNYDECKKNIERNALPNLTVLPHGLGETNAEVMMEVRTPENRGGNRIAPSSTSGSVVVQIKQLDSIVEISSFANINLIKVDVEGYELQVLRGAKQLLKKHKPVLFIELDDNNLRDQGHSAVDLIKFLQQMGYSKIEHSETCEEIKIDTDFRNCHFDIIAV